MKQSDETSGGDDEGNIIVICIIITCSNPGESRTDSLVDFPDNRLFVIDGIDAFLA